MVFDQKEKKNNGYKLAFMLTALLVVFLETNKHENVMKLIPLMHMKTLKTDSSDASPSHPVSLKFPFLFWIDAFLRMHS